MDKVQKPSSNERIQAVVIFPDNVYLSVYLFIYACIYDKEGHAMA
jgi:hypothetical protein